VVPAFRIKFPARYVATTGDMVTPYDTQGGLAPPLLILSLGAQPLADERRWQDVLRGTGDCVMVWGTNGFDTLADWHRHVYGNVAGLAFDAQRPERQQRVGAWDVVLQEVMIGGVVRAAALVRLPGTFRFYVHSCNEQSGRDVLTVIENLEVASSGR
jgi:hypothetical protein